MEHRLDAFARKLCAAAMTHRMGTKSVDYALRNYVQDRPLSDYWYRLAEAIEQATHDAPELGPVILRQASDN